VLTGGARSTEETEGTRTRRRNGEDRATPGWIVQREGPSPVQEDGPERGAKSGRSGPKLPMRVS